MATGTRGTNTMSEALQRMLSDLSQIKTMPDADLNFLIGIETTILTKLRAPVDQMVGQLDAGAPPPDPAMGGDPSMGAGGEAIPMDPSMGQPSMPGGGVPGVRQSPGAPNPDELRRLLGGSAG